MIKVVKDKVLQDILESLDELDSAKYDLYFSEYLFAEARNIFNSENGDLLCGIKVIDDKGDFLFYLVNDEDILSISSERRYKVDVNYDGCNLVKEIEKLDLQILENSDAYVISDLDEYTHAIANLILYKYPEREIYFLDDNALLFFGNKVKITHNINDSIVSKKRYMFISNTDKRYDTKPFIDDAVNIFSSVVVMANICWARKRQRYGDLNKDKTIVIIDYSKSLKMGGMGGINAIIHDVIFYANKAKEKGWIPVVNLQNSQYISNAVSDSWTCYFEQLSKITYEEAKQSFNVVEGSENGFTWTPDRVLLSPKDGEYRVLFSKPMKDYFSDNIPIQFLQSNKILGVIARGSDLKKATYSEFSIDLFIDEVIEKFSEGYDHIFLATEEQDYLEKFKKVFGDKLVYIDQKRISYDFENKEYQLIADLLNLYGEEKTEFGRKYLLITYLLAKCCSLFSTINCGARQLALRWKEGKYIFDEIYYISKRNMLKEKYYEKALIQQRIAQIVDSNNKTILYGIGRDARAYVIVQDKYKDKILFCDKRARTECLLFKGIKVISPGDLLSYTDVPIIITSTSFGDEIKCELLKLGIQERNILLIRELVE